MHKAMKEDPSGVDSDGAMEEGQLHAICNVTYIVVPGSSQSSPPERPRHSIATQISGTQSHTSWGNPSPGGPSLMPTRPMRSIGAKKVCRRAQLSLYVCLIIPFPSRPLLTCYSFSRSSDHMFYLFHHCHDTQKDGSPYAHAAYHKAQTTISQPHMCSHMRFRTPLRDIQDNSIRLRNTVGTVNPEC